MSQRFEKRPAWTRPVVYVGLPIAIIVAAAMTARAYDYDSTWIKPNGVVSATALKAMVDDFQSRITALETQVQQAQNRDCPLGYTIVTKPYLTNSVLCANGADTMVKVGTGPSAFWIDQYEATLWDAAAGPAATPTAGTQYGLSDGDADTATFRRNGQWTKPMYALSVKGYPPSRWLTWFQANEACRMGGKQLASRDEWLTAAGGTVDPGVNDGSKSAACNTQSTSAALVRLTGAGAGGCVSRWGAEDMIGNVYEWTNEWYASPGDGTAFVNQSVTSWPADEYGTDGTWNLNSWTYSAGTNLTQVAGLPAAALRGGDYENGAKDGIFTLELRFAPSYWALYAGFRCVAH